MAKIDDAKFILTRPEVVNRIKAIGEVPSTDGKRSYNVPWAVDLYLDEIGAPTPSPSIPPVVVPVPPSGISITNQAALNLALAGAKGGEVFNLADGRYSLNLTGKRYAAPVTVRGGREVVFSPFAKLTDVANLTFSGVTFAGKAGMVSGQYLLLISNVCDLSFVDVAWAGADRSGTGIMQKSGTSCRISFSGGSTSALADGHTFQNIDGLTITGHQFFGQGADDVKLSGVRNAVISKSRFHGKNRLSGAHPDGIQFQGANDSVTIADNSFEGMMQGIFGDAAASVTNLTVERNRINVSYPRALSFAANSATGSVRGNTVSSPPEAKAIVQLGGLRSDGTNQVDGRAF